MDSDDHEVEEISYLHNNCVVGEVAGVSENSPPNWYRYLPSDDAQRAPDDTAGGPLGRASPLRGGEEMLNDLEKSRVMKLLSKVNEDQGCESTPCVRDLRRSCCRPTSINV